MPIDNTIFGVFKTIVWRGVTYIAEDVKEEVSQTVNPHFPIQGGISPRIMDVEGAVARVTITAPLLIPGGELGTWSGGRPSINTIADGLLLWANEFDPSIYVNDSYSADPGAIIESAKFSVTSNDGAKYTLTFRCDPNYLYSEDVNFGTGLAIQNGGYLEYFSYEDSVLRLAQFYDILCTLGNLSGLLDNFAIEVKPTIGEMSAIGQYTQRKIFGISALRATFNGTLVNYFRSPQGYEMPWQAMIGTTPSGIPYDRSGGIARSAAFDMLIALRDGTPSGTGMVPYSILPNVSPSNVIYSTSNFDINSGVMRTAFQGEAWLTTPNPY